MNTQTQRLAPPMAMVEPGNVCTREQLDEHMECLFAYEAGPWAPAIRRDVVMPILMQQLIASAIPAGNA